MERQQALAALASALTGRHSAIRYWRSLLGLLVCIITYLALTPAPPPQATFGWDKLNHIAAFGALGGVATMGFAGAWARTGGGLIAYGVLIEVLQSFTPARNAEWGDLLADGVGITVGMPAARLAQTIAGAAMRRSDLKRCTANRHGLGS